MLTGRYCNLLPLHAQETRSISELLAEIHTQVQDDQYCIFKASFSFLVVVFCFFFAFTVNRTEPERIRAAPNLLLRL